MPMKVERKRNSFSSEYYSDNNEQIMQVACEYGDETILFNANFYNKDYIKEHLVEAEEAITSSVSALNAKLAEVGLPLVYCDRQA